MLYAVDKKCSLNLGSPCIQGMWVHKLSCEAYQELLDRGWRRSGQWLYRPLPDKQAACHCHPFTIRLDAAHFVPSKVNLQASFCLRHAVYSRVQKQPEHACDAW